jgi:site-specific recombinase XerD
MSIKFYSIVAPLIEQFIQEKRACGYKYEETPSILKCFDSFLCSNNLKEVALPENLVLQWLAKQSSEQASTHQRRIVFVRQLAKMMVRLGYPAYIVPDRFGTPRAYNFTPYIFTREEISKLIHAADQMKPNVKAPLRHIVVPEIFRLLYGCGFRLGEVLKLRVIDVDLKQGVITVKNAKFGKDRLVPAALDVVKRLQSYAKHLKEESIEKRTDDAIFFPSSWEKGWSESGIYCIFRQLLHKCGIPHGGKGKGPRVHDLRHTFAVHRLIRWV